MVAERRAPILRRDGRIAIDFADAPLPDVIHALQKRAEVVGMHAVRTWGGKAELEADLPGVQLAMPGGQGVPCGVLRRSD